MDRYYPIMGKYIEKKEFEEIVDRSIKNRDLAWLKVAQMMIASEKLGFEDEILKGIQLIFITSIIETLSMEGEFKEFSTWVNENGVEKECIDLYEEWVDQYGVRRKFIEFFDNLSEDEIKEIIPQIKQNYSKQKGKLLFAPFCFDENKCIDTSGSTCNYNYNVVSCEMLKDKTIRKKAIKKFADHLYQIRSEFVHSSRLPLFPSPMPAGAAGSSVLYDNHRDKEYEYSINIKNLYKLTMSKLEDLLNNYYT